MRKRLRIDDIGASSKIFDQYGKKTFRLWGFPFFYFPLANIGFFKRIWPFQGWGPYTELTRAEWEGFLDLFRAENVKPLIAITAAWVDEKNHLTPFPEKFPEVADLLRDALTQGEIEIANHGLTHCVVGKHLPRIFSGNRRYHREFWPELEEKIHEAHILESQKILESFFGVPITIFVPPGNVWSKKTADALTKTNIRTVICDRAIMEGGEPPQEITFMDDRKDFIVLHDRDLKLRGRQWLKQIIHTH